MDEQTIRQIIRDELSNILKLDRYVFDRKIQLLNSRDVILGTSVGNMFGTSATQKIGFLGKSPVSQQAAISASSGDDATAVNAIIAVLKAFGFTA